MRASTRLRRSLCTTRNLSALVFCSLSPVPVCAQTVFTLGGDAVVSSTYLWRGLSRSSTWSFQPDVVLAAERSRTSLAVGWWGSAELGSVDRSDPTNSGLGPVLFGENDLWVSASSRLRNVDVAGGVIRYTYAEGAFAQPADAVNTTELYAVSSWSAGPVVPRLAAWIDVERVRGAYFEVGADLRIPVLPSYDPVVAVYFTLLSGWSAGQEINEHRPEEAAYFREPGLTHLDIGLAGAFGHARRYVTVGVHVLAARDGGARAQSSPSESDSWWLTVGFSDSLILGALR